MGQRRQREKLGTRLARPLERASGHFHMLRVDGTGLGGKLHVRTVSISKGCNYRIYDELVILST